MENRLINENYRKRGDQNLAIDLLKCMYWQQIQCHKLSLFALLNMGKSD